VFHSSPLLAPPPSLLPALLRLEPPPLLHDEVCGQTLLTEGYLGLWGAIVRGEGDEDGWVDGREGGREGGRDDERVRKRKTSMGALEHRGTVEHGRGREGRGREGRGREGGRVTLSRAASPLASTQASWL